MSSAENPAPAPPDQGQLRPFDDATPLLRDVDALRARARRDGYLFFRQLLPPGPIAELRREILDIFGRHGLRAEGATGLDGGVHVTRLSQIPEDEMRLDIGVSAQMYRELQCLPRLHRLPHRQVLVGLYRDLLGAEVFVHPRHILRAMTPHPAMVPTPPHQDFPLVQGAADTWTCWFPLGDCPMSLGPLVVLRGSHRDGYLPVSSSRGAGGLAAQLCEGENDWVGGDLAAGDVLTFSSLTVHRALSATVRDQVRLSMDVRYQRLNDPIEERSLGNHADISWEEVYAKWPPADADLMYYWDAARPQLSPWNDSLTAPGGRRIC